MSVKQRGNGWQVYVTHKGKKFRQTCSTKEDATLLEAKWRHAIAIGEDPMTMQVNKRTGTASGITFGEAMDKTYDKYWAGSKNEKQVIYLMNIILKRWSRKLPINEITTNSVENYVAEMQQEGLKNSTINRRLAVISKTLKWAYRNDLLTRLPYVERMSEKGLQRNDWYSKEEEAAILRKFRELGQDYLHDFAVVSVDTGMRVSEVLSFDPTLVQLPQKRDDGSFVYGAWIPDRKNNEPVLMPVTRRVEKILRNRSFHDNVSKTEYRKAWDKVRLELGLYPKCWHTWRHTTATRLRQKGWDVANIQAFLGHKNIATTLKYAKWDTSTMVGGSNLLED
jgi:site-specific recombinase XerD